MNPDSRVVRGVSIAAIVLSALGILGGLVIALFMGIASTSLNDPAVVNALISELESSSTSSAFDGSSPYSSYDYSDMTQDDAMAVATASIFIMVGLSLGYVLCKVVCLVAGIIALRNCNNPAKLGGAFGWSIAAAIVSFLVGGMISMVLFIVSAVFIGRVRRAYAAAPMGAYGCQQPQQYQQYQQPQQYQQGLQVPQQPVNQQVPPQPQQPTQSQSSVAPQAPAAPQPPAAPQAPAPQLSDQNNQGEDSKQQ
ncbi:MAG: hypothetical protein Q4Q30_06500 [Eggerthella sp.]|nr:hypothetical protein [Eggerthella sp.]